MKKIFLLLLFLSLLLPRICLGAAADMYVTAAGAGDNSGSTWANAMTISEFETDVEGSAEAGDRYFFMEGTYTFGSSIATSLSGSATAPIQIIGVKSGTTAEPPTTADWATGDARPLWAGGIYSTTFEDYTMIMNIRKTGTNNAGMVADQSTQFINCANNQSSGSGYAFNNTSNFGSYINCDGQAASGSGFGLQAGTRLIGSYIHDSTTCITVGNTYAQIEQNVIADCTTGINFGANGSYGNVYGNTLYNGTTGISGSTANSNQIINNIFDAYTNGVSWSTSTLSNFVDYNVFDVSSTEISGATSGANNVTGDPALTDPSNQDFTLQSGSNALDVGMQFSGSTNIVGDYKINIGVDQDDVSGGTSSPHVTLKLGNVGL